MLVFTGRNVQQLLPEVLSTLMVIGVKRNTRSGPVLMFPEPVTTVFQKPNERVLFWKERDANPFFHLFEALWMLNGERDVARPAKYASNLANYSDDGVTFHGAYGYRWRYHFGFDQVETIIQALKNNPDDRRQVLSMWDAKVDLGRLGKDLPCNLQVIFQINHEGALDMMVTNRSNDIIWGAYGANVVHFSFLQEYIAARVGVPIGVYRQVSANFHAYKDVLEKLKGPLTDGNHGSEILRVLDPYLRHTVNLYANVKPLPLFSEMTDPEQWRLELAQCLVDPYAIGYKEPFFRKVVLPMLQAFEKYKKSDNKFRFEMAKSILENMPRNNDWRLAAEEWITRRQMKFLNKEKEQNSE